MKRFMPTAALAAAYIATIVAANLATAWFGMAHLGLIAVTWGTFAIGFSFIARDALHDAARAAYTTTRRRLVVIGAIAAGAAISAALTYTLTDHPHPLRLAAASGLACLAAELADMRVFTWLRERSRLGAWITSNVVAAPIDSVLFLWLAGFAVSDWWSQSLVKAVVGVAVPWLFARALREEVTTGVLLRDRLHRASA